ncbi:alkyl hydroperoxide reductase/ Thiol specific antioxidant/ Mal allergen [Beutenbergia cavernae DSM 12333]|uniref:Alkyl hydroperoxide reductase/ Thiol specific antioxidant/ Mal allergen n=1 Tax=Beutenbergia cavernae (strain ATCC BAA-8 / DSM 12333 / CCUG 43141 / JCM 11478 / NBRC 16432 / NCIMB 13614 / HKI 0122) TaxID=471853 RepID=C5C4L9_BEUC1|nr:NHL domain-containing thioredoxin family protein [Beutenbergia cavernae]ACQ82143.1 alkyl hydroperoxide reductase/ Thiol specific antioxidant/ Mal allergen [Beutenbergia cavernae DSM 12333]
MPATTRLPRVRASELVGRGWLGTGGRELSLADLRGRVVVLDFWTFCCINCLHVLDELRELEEARRDVLTIVGVHSPKFVHEADPEALAAAVDRYEVRHPVLDDPELVTWSAYGARAWPTLVVIDPEGYVVAQMAGEGHASALEALVDELVEEHRAKGTLRTDDDGGPYVPPSPTPGTLRFPAKAIALENGNLLVADAGHHSLAELGPDGETLVRRVGSGERGLVDGGPNVARFSEPNGLCLVPVELRARLGYDVLVADTVNHALRGVRLADGHVSTVAGTGQQYVVGAPDNASDPHGGTHPVGFGDQFVPTSVKLSSPWDVAWSPDLAAFVVAMAGNHTLWAFDDEQGSLTRLAGTEHEGLRDGPAAEAWFAQPSGLAVAQDGRIWVADSETSALRWLDPAGGDVHTAVGQGLFEFGHRDGAADQALLQHPLGVAALPDASVLVADTYNGALRRHDPATGVVTTIATGLAEPSDVVVLQASDDDGGPAVLVVESAGHRITRVALPAELRGSLHDGAAHRTQRPVTELAAGALRLEVPFLPAPGQKLDDRYGPATRLQVSATPPELLVSGAGDDVDLARDLVLAPGEGVLHVTAQAASCDADPAIEYPACHLAQQDWGVPVRVVARTDDDDAAEPLVLPLRG